MATTIIHIDQLLHPARKSRNFYTGDSDPGDTAVKINLDASLRVAELRSTDSIIATNRISGDSIVGEIYGDTVNVGGDLVYEKEAAAKTSGRLGRQYVYDFGPGDTTWGDTGDTYDVWIRYA